MSPHPVRSAYCWPVVVISHDIATSLRFSRPRFRLCRKSRLGPPRPRAPRGQPDRGDRDDPPAELADLPRL